MFLFHQKLYTQMGHKIPKYFWWDISLWTVNELELKKRFGLSVKIFSEFDSIHSFMIWNEYIYSWMKMSTYIQMSSTFITILEKPKKFFISFFLNSQICIFIYKKLRRLMLYKGVSDISKKNRFSKKRTTNSASIDCINTIRRLTLYHALVTLETR